MSGAIFGHFKILQDENRVRLLRILEQSRCNVGELCDILQMPQPTISRHLKKLLEDGWLQRETKNTTSSLGLTSNHCLNLCPLQNRANKHPYFDHLQ